MNYNVIVTPNFNKEAKRLKKKFPSLKNELAELILLLENEPFQGIPLGQNCYKIRIAIVSKGKGKSGGARIISYISIIRERVYLLSIYDKSEQQDVSNSELNSLLRALP